jgi:hypothetical protein
MGEESLKRDADGTLMRKGTDNSDGSSFDSRATLSADGNTITDLLTTKAKDGRTVKMTMVYNRVKGTK